MKRIYLDYAATTPVDTEVLRAMKPYFADQFGNPGSLHYPGQEAIAALDRSRETIAKSIGANFREIIFTSSATEANNLALRGAISNFEFLISSEGQDPNDSKFKPRIVISATEHESVLETARDLERWGVEVIYLPVDKNGLADLKKLKSSLNENTVLVSIMYVNNETGVIQPIGEISKIISDFKGQQSKFEIRNSKFERPWPLFHTDASQALQYLNCNVDDLGVDLMTLSSHKIYGPKGAGCLYIRNPLPATSYQLQASTTGGGQEFNLRSGTENIPAIVGFAKAVEIVDSQKPLANRTTKELQDRLWRGIKKIYPKAQLNGDALKRLPNNINVYLPGINAEEFLIKLDLAGVAVSTGSACKARALDSSHVLEAMGFNKLRAKNSLRFSLGRPTTQKDIDTVLKIIKIIKK